MTNPILKVQYDADGSTFMTIDDDESETLMVLKPIADDKPVTDSKPLPKGKHFLAPCETDTGPLASGWTLELDGKPTGFYGAYMEVAALAMFESNKPFRIHRMPDAAKGV